MVGNPDIVKYGERTRFGQPNGPDPSIIAKNKNPSSIRAAIRRIAAMEVDQFQQVLKKREMTLAQAIAIRKFQKALVGDLKAMQQLEDAIDGKLTKKATEACATLVDLVNGALEDDK